MLVQKAGLSVLKIDGSKPMKNTKLPAAKISSCQAMSNIADSIPN